MTRPTHKDEKRRDGKEEREGEKDDKYKTKIRTLRYPVLLYSTTYLTCRPSLKDQPNFNEYPSPTLPKLYAHVAQGKAWHFERRRMQIQLKRILPTLRR